MKHTRKLVRALSATLVTFGTMSLFSLPSQAAVVIGNLPQVNENSGSSIQPVSMQKAVVFTMGNQAFTVDNVILRLYGYNTATDVALLGLFLDNGSGSNIGTQVGSFLQAPVSTSNGSANFTFFPGGSLPLAANTRYWLLLDTSASIFEWPSSDPSVTPVGTGAALDFYRFSTDNGATYSSSSVMNSFQINGTAVPEPSLTFLLGIGALATFAHRKRTI